MTVDKKHSPRCFIDIEIDGENAGRIIVELFIDVCPITCENFRALCTGEKGVGKTTDKPLHYKGAPFHRVVKNFVIQGGDFVAGNGTSGESIYGGQFKDENFTIPHDKPFLLSMSNRGKDSNGSQFFIITQAAPHLNGKHTVFGQVIHGQEVVTKIENIKTDPNSRPLKDVKISNCGELVLKIHQKERKRHVSTESSQSESEEERLKRKRKHKHSKKHKKEKKEVREPNPSRKEEDSGCMVDPEEIPTIPTNNFLMRRTSPLGDRNRRPPQRESYSYGRPVVSRSGRKIKGRGFMRYRTPSRSTSRSGSETPPHWKQAQSRLINVKDVVLPKRPDIPPPPEESESQPEDMEDARGNVLHSRLGMVSRATDEQKQRDARLIMRENRRNREWSSEESPTRNASKGATGGSPLRSTVVVASNFQKEPDRWRTGADWRGGNRRGRSPERRPFDRSNDNDGNRNRRQVAADSHKKPERPQRSEKAIVKSFRALAGDLLRYRKDIDSEESTEEEKDPGDKGKDQADKNKDREIKAKESKPEKPPKVLSKKVQSLKNELFRYRKDAESSTESSEEDEGGNANAAFNARNEPQVGSTKNEPHVGSARNESQVGSARYESQATKRGNDSEKVAVSQPPKRAKALQSLQSELARYRKDQSESSSEDSSDENNTSPKKLLPRMSEENIRSNGQENNERITLTESLTGFGIDHSKVKIPGICDSNEASMDTDRQAQFSVVDVEFEAASRQVVEVHNIPDPLIGVNEANADKVLPVVKEKRRWDMQQPESKKASESIQLVFHTTALTTPAIIPLPEETRSVNIEPMDVSEPEGMQHTLRRNTPPMDYRRSRSRSPNEKVPSSPPMKSSRHRKHDASVSPDHQHSSIIARTTSKERRSPSPPPRHTPRSPLNLPPKHTPRSPSNSPPPTRRKSSSSTEPRTKKLRSKSPVPKRARSRSQSPIPRRGRASKSRSQSPILRRARLSKSPRRPRPSASRSRSRDRIRRRRSRSPLNRRRSISRDRGSRFRRYGNRSPNRFRYGKSPSFRGRLGGRARRTRSRSPVRRRRAARRSSSSSSSRSSSSRGGRRKKVIKGKRRSSSSSSSSRSKKSGSDSGSN